MPRPAASNCVFPSPPASATSSATGLIFYKEHELMDGSQLARVLAGCAVCIGGIALSQSSAAACASGHRAAHVRPEPE